MAPSPPRLRILSGTFPILPRSHDIPLSPFTLQIHNSFLFLGQILHFIRFYHIYPSYFLSNYLTYHSTRYYATMGKRRLMCTFCVVGGNAVSAFLSWRLQTTNSCDVTLVWKSGFESVAQYGVSFRYFFLPVDCLDVSDESP